MSLPTPLRFPHGTAESSAYSGFRFRCYSDPVYRVAGEGEPVALVPLDRMLARVQGLAEELTALARRNEALALEVGQLRERTVGQGDQLAAKEETIAELRRRAEVAEGEGEALRERLAAAEAAPAQLAPEEDHTAVIARSSEAAAAHLVESRQPEEPATTVPAPTLWRRVRRAFGGGD